MVDNDSDSTNDFRLLRPDAFDDELLRRPSAAAAAAAAGTEAEADADADADAASQALTLALAPSERRQLEVDAESGDVVIKGCFVEIGSSAEHGLAAVFITTPIARCRTGVTVFQRYGRCKLKIA